MMEKLQLAAVPVALVLAVLFPTTLVWLILVLAVVLVIREQIQQRRER